MRLRHRLAAVALLVAAGCAARQPVRSPAPAAPPFLITFWCGPPLAEFNDARAAEIAAAGFTIVGPPCEGDIDPPANRAALDVAARHGLRLWLSDQRFGKYALLAADWESRLDAAIAEYAAHPAFAGYFLTDEPAVPEFDSIARLVARLRSRDPAHLAYVNLLPDFVPPQGLGAETYHEYVERFIATVQPPLLSYDYYPFRRNDQGENKDRTTFFRNLATIRAQSLEHRLPFMLIVLAMPHAHYRDPTEAELSWQVYNALAFGARGISYFTYWTPVNVEGAEVMHFHYGLIENGRPTRHYFEAAHLNRTIAALGDELAAFDSLAVADSSGEIGGPFPIGPIDAVDGGPITVGLFMNDDGALAALLVNRDYEYGVTAQLRLRAGATPPQAFDVASRRWDAAGDLSFPLPPGGAQLLRWQHVE